MAILSSEEYKHFMEYAIRKSSDEELKELKKDHEFYLEMIKKEIQERDKK